MPRIYVEWVEGRSQEKHDALAKLITEAVVRVDGVKPEQVTIVYRELACNRWYKGGISRDKLIQGGGK